MSQEDPLQEERATHSSILAWKNAMDWGAWQPTVHGVAKSQIQLSEHAHKLEADGCPAIGGCAH